MLIVFLMGTYFYRFYYDTIYKDFESTNDVYLSSIINRHENDLKILRDIAVQISASDGINEFRLKEDPLKSIELEKQLHQYLSVSQFFNQILFVPHNDNYLYNQVTSVQIDRFLNEGFLLENTSEEMFKNYLYTVSSEMKVLPEQGFEGYLLKKYSNVEHTVTVYFLPVLPKYKSTLAFVVGNSYYDQLLQTQPDEMRRNFIYYNNRIIVSRGSLDLDNEAILSAIQLIEKGSYKVTLDNEKYLMTMHTDLSGMTYGTLQSLTVFQEKMLSDQWLIFVALILGITPTALLLTYLAKKASDRINKINRLLHEEEESRYGLENIESGIRALVKHNEETSKESIPLRKSRLISNFIRNEFSDREALIAEANRAGLSLDKKYYVVILVGDRGNNDANGIFELMTSQWQQVPDVDGYGINLIINGQSLFVLFGDDRVDLENFIHMIFTKNRSVNSETIMSMSNYHADISEASQAYLEADTAFDNRFLLDNDAILQYKDVTVNESLEPLPDMYLQVLKSAIRQNNEEQVTSAIDEICGHLQSGKHSLLAFRLLYNDIIQVLIKEWKPDDANFKYIYNVFTLSQCLTLKDFNDVLCDACKVIMGSRRTEEQVEGDLMEEAMNFMRDNYHDSNLNMSFLADYLKVSPVTLSIEFKHKTEMSPSDYLLLLRMENAKELLKNTDQKIKQISIAVGYEDDHVFMRRFKQYVGKTPAQFRKEFLDLEETK